MIVFFGFMQNQTLAKMSGRKMVVCHKPPTTNKKLSLT